MVVDQVKAMVFDVFGTVVDWRGSVIAECEALGSAKGLAVDWSRFADDWRRDGYSEAIAKIRRGEAPWVTADVLHRTKLDELLLTYGIGGLSESEIDHLSKVWHRLDPWPDSVPGLTRLRRKYILSPLSNGNIALLTNMAKRAGLPWDCILSAELVGHYKPHPDTYLGAARFLGIQPGELMMVAAHLPDLRAAHELGLRTAFVPRPLEWGPGGHAPPEAEPHIDIVATDFEDLAAKMGT